MASYILQPLKHKIDQLDDEQEDSDDDSDDESDDDSDEENDNEQEKDEQDDGEDDGDEQDKRDLVGAKQDKDKNRGLADKMQEIFTRSKRIQNLRDILPYAE